jgi:asparagine synthase (glutamine-hydrolysing)
MCGICGIASLNGSGVDKAVLEAMSETLVHRGPDSGGAFVDTIAGLAARRLAIIDLTGGDQPIANEDGTVTVVQNGEIYNYRELRKELEGRGHRFSTHSDTEVLVHLYEERGPHFPEKLRGMFAVAIWDARERRLVLARDRYGIKPLYYRVGQNTLSFASELKALLRQPGISREIDLDGLEAYLAFSCIPAPLTIFREVRKLPAGSVLVWTEKQGANGVRIERYAQPESVHESAVRSESEEDLAEELRTRLRDSVRAHLIADVPVGILLSGGIDSAALTAFAALESSERVSTFSIGFEERSFDERARARVVAERYGTDHHELVLRPNAVELLPRIAEVFDEPFADSSAVPTYLVSELARSHVKVAMSGEGGDELFGGYFNYVGHRLAPIFGRFASAVRPLVERLPASTAKASSFDYKAKHFVRAAGLPPLERHYMWKGIFSPAARDDILRPECRGSDDPIERLRATYAESEGAEELARIMDLDLRVFLVEDMLVKTDRASMAQSLEARVPFLDPVVTELALALPGRHKVRWLGKKRLLRKALAPLLPSEILNGRKQGFSIPVGAWLRGELEPVARGILSSAALRRQGFFQPEPVGRMLDAHVAGEQDFSRQLWNLLVFSLWHDRYVDGSGPA